MACLNRVAWIWKAKYTSTFNSLAISSDVGYEDAGQRAHVRVTARSASDFNGGAIHVHLAITNLVEPGPGEYVLTTADLLGHWYVKLAHAFQSFATGTLDIGTGKVALGRSRAAADDGMNHFPVLGVCRRGFGNRELTRAATMYSSTLEGDGDCAARSYARRGIAIAAVQPSLAGERKCAVERVALGQGVVWLRRCHSHMAQSWGEKSGQRCETK